MSDTVISSGFIGLLNTPIPKEEREEVSDRLYNLRTGLGINYQGTLVYIDFNRDDKMIRRVFEGDFLHIGAGGTDVAKLTEFFQRVQAAELDINSLSVRPYTCIWYNGVDFPLSLMTLDEYLVHKQ